MSDTTAIVEIHDALIAGASRVGFAVADLELLRIGNNYVYADRKNRLIYRVSVRERDTEELCRENSIIADLAERGAPILGPIQIEPITLSTGHLATVWPLGDPPESNPVLSLAPILAGLHDVAAVRGMSAWAGFERGRYRVGIARESDIPAELIDDVDRRLEDLAYTFPGWSTGTVVHGDPHTGNLVKLNGRHLLIDLDDLALGCPEIDLAPLCTSYRRFGGVAGDWPSYLNAYGRPVDTDLLEWFVRLRQLTMVAWLFTLWDFRPESRDEATHRVNTLDKAAKWNPL